MERADLLSSRRTWTAFSALGLILAANAILLYCGAFRGFILFDFGAFLDASWRVYRGQRIYVDFFYTTGPVHLFLNAFFFMLFGFSKAAILAHLVTTSSLVVLMTFFLFLGRIPLLLTLAVSLLSATGYYWHYPHPWYDQSAHLWGLIAVTAIAWQHPFQNAGRARWTGALAGAMAMLSFMTKSNVGGAYGLIFPLVLLLAPFHWDAVTGFAAGLVGAFLLVLVPLGSPWPYLDNAVVQYGLKATGQLRRFTYPPTFFKNLYWLPAAAILPVVWRLPKETRPLLVLFLGTGAVGLFAVNTGSLRSWDHLPPFGIYLGLGFLILEQGKTWCVTRTQKMLRLISVLVLSAAVLIQIQRSAASGIRHATGGTLRHYVQGDYPLKAAPLRGWLFERADGMALDGIVQYINEEVPKDESLLILCDLQIVNALTGRDSYIGVPFLWHIGILPAPGQALERVHRNITSHPPDWILTSRDPKQNSLNPVVSYLRLPPEFLAQYGLVKNWGLYGLFKRQTGSDRP